MRESTVGKHVVSLYFLSQCHKRNFLSTACAYMLDAITTSTTKLASCLKNYAILQFTWLTQLSS